METTAAIYGRKASHFKAEKADDMFSIVRAMEKKPKTSVSNIIHLYQSDGKAKV